MLHASKYNRNMEFKSELHQSVDTSQTMIEQLVKVNEELSSLQNDLNSHQSNLPALERIKCTLNRCKTDISRAVEVAHTLHIQQRTVTDLMDQPKTNTADARSITSDVQRLSGVLFTLVSSIEESLEDVKREVQSIQSAHKPQVTSWWGKIWAWCVNTWSKLFGGGIQNIRLDISPREWASISERVTNAQNNCSDIGKFEGGLIKSGEKTLAALDEMDELRAENERLKLELTLSKASAAPKPPGMSGGPGAPRRWRNRQRR
ncbi:hypothetical protein FRC08_010843 [Ceratobasidium sp. 394]|nr:hypothetical protein FRC08_010843 [Ceratobasidium sp. 394]